MRKKFVVNVLYPGFTLIDLNGDYFEVVDGDVSVLEDGSLEFLDGALEPLPEGTIIDPILVYDLREEI